MRKVGTPPASIETAFTSPMIRAARLRVRTLVGVVLICCSGRVVQADTGVPVGPGETWQVWNWDPVLLLNLAVLWWLYGRGLGRLWSRAGVGHGVNVGRPLAFLGGIVVIVAGL